MSKKPSEMPIRELITEAPTGSDTDWSTGYLDSDGRKFHKEAGPKRSVLDCTQAWAENFCVLVDTRTRKENTTRYPKGR